MINPHLGKVRFKALQIFLLAQELGSLRAVAEVVNTSQPAITQMLQELERTFGQTLLQRERSGVTLTPAGHLLAQRARVALTEMDTAIDSLKAPIQTPILRIGTLPFMMFNLLPKALQTLHQEQGLALRLRFHEATVPQLRERLLRSDDDLVLTRLTTSALDCDAFASMRIHHLTKDMLTLFVGQRNPLYKLARKGTLIEPALLANCQWALPHESTETRHFVDELLVQSGLAPASETVETSSFNGGMLLVSETHLVGAGPLSGVERMTNLLKLAPLRIKGAFSARTQAVAIHHARHDQNPEIIRFIEVLARTARENSPSTD